MAKELTPTQQKTLARVLERQKKAKEATLRINRSSYGDFGDKICKGCGQPFKITCKTNLKTKLYCKDKCKLIKHD